MGSENMISSIAPTGLFTTKLESVLAKQQRTVIDVSGIYQWTDHIVADASIEYYKYNYTLLKLFFPNLNTVASGVVNDAEAEGIFGRFYVAHTPNEIWQNRRP